MDALHMAGHSVELASDFRSFEGSGDAARQTALRQEGGAIARSLALRWRAMAKADRPELWLTYHLYYKAPDWLGPRISADLGIPYVISEASYAPKRADGPWAIGHLATQRAIHAAALLLCPTGDDVPGLQLVASATTRITRLPPFLDPAPYRVATQARAAHRSRFCVAHGLSAGAVWIVVVAMMRHGDKLASYRVLASVLRRLIDLPWELVVAGDGPARGEIQAMLESAAPGRARFLGECGADTMAAIYAASDLSVWPAVNEAYGMAMLEAQAAGIAVVSCAVRGVPDVVCDGRTGLLAAPGDVQELANLVRRLLLDPPYRVGMGRAAAQFVDAERSVERAAGRLNLAFEGLREAAATSLGGVVAP